MSVVLFLSPQALAPDKDGNDSEWTKVLKILANKDYISLLAIDKAHYVNLHGKSFRPEFIKSIHTLNDLYELCTTKPPRLVMSAKLSMTFSESSQTFLFGQE